MAVVNLSNCLLFLVVVVDQADLASPSRHLACDESSHDSRGVMQFLAPSFSQALPKREGVELYFRTRIIWPAA